MMAFTDIQVKMEPCLKHFCSTTIKIPMKILKKKKDKNWRLHQTLALREDDMSKSSGMCPNCDVDEDDFINCRPSRPLASESSTMVPFKGVGGAILTCLGEVRRTGNCV